MPKIGWLLYAENQVAPLRRKMTPMDESKKIAAIAAGKASADEVLKWLDSGGRDRVQEALRKALELTAERNKARELDPDFLERRVTF